MKLTIERERLLKPLGHVTSVVERRHTLPILANVHIRAKPSTLELTGTDLEIEVCSELEDVKTDTGDCTVTARKFFDICRALPEGATLKINISGDKATIQSGKSRFTLQTLPASDFPKLETENWEERFTVSQAELKKLLEQTAFSMAQQDVRYYLNGLLLELTKDKLRAVATDGHRLAKSDLAVKGGGKKMRQAIVPRKAILELGRLLENEDADVTVEMNPNHFRLTTAGVTFTTKLIDGRFPDYEAVMAPELDKTIVVSRHGFLDVLSRAAIMTNEKFRGIRLGVEKDRLEVSANNPEQEEASDEIPVDYDGESVEIGFNVNYLMDALKALPGEEVELKLRDANSSCTMSATGETDTLYLVMPMRL